MKTIILLGRANIENSLYELVVGLQNRGVPSSKRKKCKNKDKIKEIKKTKKYKDWKDKIDKDKDKDK